MDHPLATTDGGLPEARALYVELERGGAASRALTAYCEALARRAPGTHWAVIAWAGGHPLVQATSASVPSLVLDHGRSPAALGGESLRVLRLGGEGLVCTLHELRGPQADAVGALAVFGPTEPDETLLELLAAASGPATVATRIACAEGALHASAGWARVEPLGVLAGGVAHEFNNLLTAMAGNLALAQMHTRGSSPAAAFLDALDRSMRRAGTIAAQMLAFSGRGHVDVHPTSLDAVIDQSMSRLELLVPPRCRVRAVLPRGLPEVTLDVEQFEQALAALVENAGEAVGDAPGSVTIEARVVSLGEDHEVESWSPTPLAPGEYVRLRVADDGDGMPPEVASRVFDPFFSTRGPGRGLGLCAVLGILRGHAAGLRLSSTPGQGTRVDLYLPVRVSVPAPGARPAPDASVVLVVDDDEVVRDTIASMLRRRGLVPVLAQDGVEAVERWHEHGSRISLVLLDLVMPRMDGPQTWHALRDLGADVPIVLCTGYDDSRSPRPIPYGGLAGSLRKPFDRRTFDEVVTSALAARA